MFTHFLLFIRWRAWSFFTFFWQSWPIVRQAMITAVLSLFFLCTDIKQTTQKMNLYNNSIDFMVHWIIYFYLFTQLLFWAGDQGNHQNFNPSLLLKTLWLIFMGMKQKKSKITDSKKTEFFYSANSQYFFSKISWIDPWVSRIDCYKGHWCGSTYMVVRLSNISSKTDKKCFLCVFRLCNVCFLQNRKKKKLKYLIDMYYTNTVSTTTNFQTF